jgi:3-deoxy-D-manno-octulosonic-acid transferase
MVVSTLTRTGLERARRLPEVHLSLLFPLDAPRAVRRLLERLRLEAFFFTETEIWPTTLLELAASGVPALMVSGRVSRRTAERARWLRRLYRPALAHVFCCMQSEEDAARIVRLGADPRHVQVAGSLKFDAALTEPPAEVRRVGDALGVPDRPMVVAGSTHEGEDEALLAAYDRLVRGHPDLLLLLAPRHPERLPHVAGLVEAAGFRLVRYTDLVAERALLPVAAPSVVLLDVLGQLPHLYALASVAFVGGTLVPVGGHNPIEPARARRPVVVGAHTEHVAELVERLVSGGGAVRAASPDGLALVLDHLLADPARALDMGRRAHALVESGQGALERHLKIIAARLTSLQFAHARGEA